MHVQVLGLVVRWNSCLTSAMVTLSLVMKVDQCQMLLEIPMGSEMLIACPERMVSINLQVDVQHSSWTVAKSHQIITSSTCSAVQAAFDKGFDEKRRICVCTWFFTIIIIIIIIIIIFIISSSSSSHQYTCHPGRWVKWPHPSPQELVVSICGFSTREHGKRHWWAGHLGRICRQGWRLKESFKRHPKNLVP